MNTNDIIEDALQTYPLAEVPPNLSQNIMQQIQQQAKKTQRNNLPHIPFRLTWVDYALAFFLTLIPLVGLVIWATLPRLFLLRLTFQWQLIQVSNLFPVLGISLLLTGILLLSAFLFSLNLMLRPESSLR